VQFSIEVIRRRPRGEPGKCIAQALQRSVKTVEKHRAT